MAHTSPRDRSAAAASARGARVAFLVGAALLVVTGILIAIAVANVVNELLIAPRETIYFVTPAPPEPTAAGRGPVDAYALNLTVEQFDETRGLATLRVQGSRACPTTYPAGALTVFALGTLMAERLGLPPQATATWPANTQEGTGFLVLPFRGEPRLYPFDTYELILGVLVQQALPDGTMAPLTLHHPGPATYVTLETQVQGMQMAAPMPVDPASVRLPADPSTLLFVRRLHFERPLYLRVLTVLLVGLIGAATAYSIRMQSLQQLFVGLGGLILGVWGVRNVLIPGAPPFVTAVDLLLSAVILLLLAGILARATFQFREKRSAPTR